ncbi:MAG: efflux RND transporter periplasmic adaptor subunit, partial [Ignavibacteriae bacterium]|nr:efflux RND transporter periplasmic adaptor subunit [Ignavibacteriota bacterium]
MANKVLWMLSLVSIIVLSSCESKHKEEKHNTKYLVTTPLQKDTLITTDYVSQIHAYQHIELRALEKGYLQKIFVDEGQYVHKGQKMFKIMPNVYEADLQKMKAEAELAQIEYNNTKLLADKNVVSKNELALDKAKLDKANAELRLAQTHLNFTDVNAPFDGIMDHFHVREGSLVDEGELLTTLSDNSKMWVYFNVPESQYLEYISKKQQGTKEKVQLRMANGDLFSHDGVIETIEGEFNNETGNIQFRATFPNPDKILRHGQTGSVVLKSMVKNAILIPQKATFEVLDRKYVFVVDKDNIVHQKQIKVAQSELPYLFIVTK